ncbi:methyl-accepting chemotaxis sensory transducer with GAF sensor [Rippkaea orientalis PCC 8801]|uniref:Methyl-accepting chemotaxis sensory transducer with GAF sensor n=1 Tax=Rippkaea orientalis (strain PCC 8801 / RF-1) TaxID=41431 RepID=B7JZ98_RIPO1|nr:methyl-accepting chemotaxis protein [Rippkaea orientalis]ACK67309.1 methyl-accepting chemotaxis sensory transducer with GAF sensor [Rippkaea orientalis PCC 8801]
MTHTSPKSNPQNTNGKTPIPGKPTHHNSTGSETAEESTAPITPISEVNQLSTVITAPRLTLPVTHRTTSLDPSKLPKTWRTQQLVQWWQKLNLRSKTIVAATLMGVVPVVIVGSITYGVVHQGLTKQVLQFESTNNQELGALVNRFMRDRYFNIQELATWDIFTNPQLRTANAKKSQQAALDNFIKISPIYDSIAFFDLTGNVISQSQGTPLKNHQDRSYFQEALKSGKAVISQPLLSATEGTVNVYFAAPVKDKFSGKIVGVVRARMPVKFLQEIVKKEADLGEVSYLINKDQEIFLSSKGIYTTSINSAGKKDERGEQSTYKAIEAQQEIKAYDKLAQKNLPLSIEAGDKLVAFAPLGELDGLPNLGWNAVTTLDKSLVFAPQNQLLAALFWGTLLTAVSVGAIAVLLAERATRPLRQMVKTVKKIGEGNLEVEVPIQGQDELAVLGSSLNSMTQRLKTLIDQQSVSVEEAKVLVKVAGTVVSDSLGFDKLVNEALDQAKTILRTERIVVYQFDLDGGNGYISHESVSLGYSSAFNTDVGDRCIPHRLLQDYKQGRIVATPDVYQAGFHPEHLALMERLGIKANLVVPIVRPGQLFGLLIAHHCQQSHLWQENEIIFLKNLAEQFATSLDRLRVREQREKDNQKAEQLKEITLRMAAAVTTEKILETCVNQVRSSLNSDRVIVYRFDATWNGTIIAESVAEEFPRALGAEIRDPCFAQRYVEKYRQGRVAATPDIYNAGLTQCHLKQLEPFQVKANLVAPVLRKGKLLGLLITHQCSGTRDWEQGEINFFSQVATQVGFALERADLLEGQKLAQEKQRQAKEKLQQRALELLMEVDPVSRGDLTIRAHVTEDEIGTIADSYNATIENLRKIVTQVQQSAGVVANTTNTNESAVRALSEESHRQAEEIAAALDRLQAMTHSIRAVATNAELAQMTVQQATHTVESGEEAMNRTVDGIMAIRETVAETAKKVKRLGESSQKISKVVNLISSFADQTNLLALNASIEAAHAGEEGRGFAVVASEVRSLARQSAEATAEIEALVASIQAETNEVVAAMEAGTQQVVTGTKLVDETRKSLNQITAASVQITELVEAITKAAVEQSATSQSVTQTMTEVAAISNKTSSEAAQVSDSFKQLLDVAQTLQESVRQFKVQ